MNLIRMQKLSEKISNSLPSVDIEDAGSVVFRAPHDMTISVLRRELEEFANSLTESAKAQSEFSRVDTMSG